MSLELSKAGFNPGFLDQLQKKDPKEIKQFDSLDKALDFANEHTGDEAVVKTKDENGKDTYAVINLKSGVKSEDVFDPKGVTFQNAFITRGDRKIELIPSEQNDLTTEIDNTETLANVAETNKTSGLSQSKAYNNYSDRMPAYQANMVTVLDKVIKVEEKITAKKDSLSKELETLKSANPPDSAAITSKEKEISVFDTKLDELKTSKGILTSKLLMMPSTRDPNGGKGGVPVPGATDLMIGDMRNKKDQVISALSFRINELQNALIKEKDPAKVESIKSQLSQLEKEVSSVNTTSLQIQEAALKIRMRVGSLATMSSALTKAQDNLKSQVSELADLKAKFDISPAGEIKDGLKDKITILEGKIESTRKDLIKTMEAELKTYKSNSPTIGGKLQNGAQAAVDLLQIQIEKLKSVEGKKPEDIASAVKEVQTTFNEELLSAKVEKASKYFDGITPAEGTMIKDISSNTDKYLKDYGSAKTDMAKFKIEVEKAIKAMGPNTFKYDDLDVKDLKDALKWSAGQIGGLTGVESNKIINTAYDKLDQDFTRYITGSDTDKVSNWMSYGKFASREAGSQIQNLEGALEGIQTLLKVDVSAQNDKRAIDALIKIMDTGPMTEQAFRMAATSMGIIGADKGMSKVDLITAMVKKMASSPSTAIPAIQGVVKDLETLHAALVIGNVGIYNNIAPAYDIFLKAEANGGDGVKALKEAGYSPSKPPQAFIDDKNKDPQGFITKAFGKYQEAKTHEQNARIFEAQAKDNPDKAPELLKKAENERSLRDKAMHQANLLIGCQEQMCILQKPDVFGNPKVSDMLHAMTGTMSIKDIPDGKGDYRDNKLLSPNSATKDENWADFGTRMGMVDVTSTVKSDADAVTQGLVKVFTPGDTKPHYFKLPDGNNGIPKGPKGTISEYFAENLKNPELIATAPRDIKPLYRDSVEGQVTTLDRLDDVVDTVGITVSAPATIIVNSPELVVDGSKWLYHQIF